MGEISQAFLEGMQELYSIMFTNQIYLSLLDEENTHVNIYEESLTKAYQPSILLTGKVSNNVEENERPLEEVKFSYIITIPTKELIDNNIPHTPQDFYTLKKSKITFKGVDYDINYIQPSTLIDEEFLVYKFYCIEVLKKSGDRY